MLKKNFLNHIYKDRFFFLFFFLFIVYYFFNFNLLNDTYATDYQVRYKPNGNNIVNILKNLQFSRIDLSFFFRSDYNFINPYLVPELITGLILNLTSNENIFSIFSNILNMILLFLSFYIFFKPIKTKNKDKVIFCFLSFFFIYIGNWVWCFWKLADVYFLFIFSIIFFYTSEGISKNKISYIIYSFFFCIISIFTKPQGIIMFPFLLISFFTLYHKKKKNFFYFIIISIIIYFLFFPLLVFFLQKINYNGPLEIFVQFMSKGYISGTIFYRFEDFQNQFNLSESNSAVLFYYYILFLKKILYQIIFLRETYSLRHNIFLIFYISIFYYFLFINFNYLVKKYNLYFKLTIIITILSILLHSSLNTADEPNRHQLFMLVPLYVLVSISFIEWLKKIKIFRNLF
jgi:hypothetical protein